MQEKIMQDFFQRFQSEVLIKDIMARIDKYPVKSTGIQHSYNCPFHSDSTPSFYVNTERNVFRCFGCERGGGPYKLIKAYLLFSLPTSNGTSYVSPQQIVTWAGVDFQLPTFYQNKIAEPGKNRRFQSQLEIKPIKRTTESKAVVITRIMMNVPEDTFDAALWEEFFREIVLQE